MNKSWLYRLSRCPKIRPVACFVSKWITLKYVSINSLRKYRAKAVLQRETGAIHKIATPLGTQFAMNLSYAAIFLK